MEKIGMKMKNNITIKEGFEEFIRRCEVKNYSAYTTRYYNTVIMVFALFCSMDSPIKVINEDLINQYVLHLRETGIKDHTVLSYMKGMRPVMLQIITGKFFGNNSLINLQKVLFVLREIYRRIWHSAYFACIHMSTK